MGHGALSKRVYGQVGLLRNSLKEEELRIRDARPALDGPGGFTERPDERAERLKGVRRLPAECA